MSQEEIVASQTATDITSYDLLVKTNIPESADFEMELLKTFGLEVTITNTNPMTNLEFDISEIAGNIADIDALDFGKPDVKFGSAYQFSDTDPTPTGRLVHLPEIRSDSGKH